MAMTVTAADDGTASALMATPAQRRALRRLRDTMGAFEAQLQCPICLCAYATPASLPCNHCFCEECIHRALELKQVCPICKAPAKKRSLRHDTMIQQLQQAVELWLSVPDAVDLSDEDQDKSTTTTTLSNGYHATEPKSEPVTPIKINPLIVSQSAESATRRRKREQQNRELLDGRHQQTTAIETAATSPLGLAASTANGRNASAGDEHHQKTNGSKATKLPKQEHVEEPPAKKRAREKEEALGAHSMDAPLAVQGGSNDDYEQDTTPAFVVGQLVEVIDRTWRGVNKPGGAAWIMHIHDDGTYDVKYIIGTRRESRVPDQYILIANDAIVSLATPGRTVKQHRRKAPAKIATPPSVDLLSGFNRVAASATIHHHYAAGAGRNDLVFLCSGYTEEGTAEIRLWADALGAQVVDNWSPFVTHLIAKCATPKEVAASAAEDERESGGSGSGTVTSHAAAVAANAAASRKRSLFKDESDKKWVKIRSMKYLKALVAGRWIVSEAWLKDCVKRGKRLAELAYEADGHLKAQNVSEACRRSRLMREANLRACDPETISHQQQPWTVGSQLFVDLCFHIYGEFLPPMPPPSELDTLIRLGDGKVLRFLDEIALEMDKPVNHSKTLVVVCDKLNQNLLRRTAKELTAMPQLQSIDQKHVVSYQWILNSISEAKLRPFT